MHPQAYSGFSSVTGVNYEMQIEWPWTAGAARFLYKMTATGNYLNGAPPLAFPDLSGLTGFLVPPGSGTVVLWGARTFLSIPIRRHRRPPKMRR